ncbi:MAG: hypothetical protein NC254_00710 [bacterium]|nr:hypothetical protein [bacterium]
MKKLLALVLSLALCMSVMAGCGGSDDKKNDGGNTSENVTAGNDTQGDSAAGSQNDQDDQSASTLDMSQKIKMGVLVSDSTTAESLAFQSYYKQYIAGNFNVELMYSDELVDAAGEKAAIETFIMNNCKAVISFSSFDRMAQLNQCADAGVYYAVATGTLTDEEYESVKSNEYYVGAIGPSLDVEFQAGYDMAKYYLDQGKTNFAIFGGALPYYTEMHIYRAAGMLTAMVEAGGDGANYLGATDAGSIIGKIYETATLETGAIGNINLVGYVGGYDMDDAWFAKCGQMAQTEGLEVILAVGNGSDFFGTSVQGTDVKIASVDAYASAYGEAMEAGMLDYLAGKFSASIGPIFAATYSATLGAPIRTGEGYALALDQGYWVATSYEQFSEYYAVDSSVEAPAYTKEMLEGLLGADYAVFAEFVGKYSFDEIKQLQ